MVKWILENKQWLFSGLGIIGASGLWKILVWGKNKWSEGKFSTRGNFPAGLFPEQEYETLATRGKIMNIPAQILRLFLRPE